VIIDLVRLKLYKIRAHFGCLMVQEVIEAAQSYVYTIAISIVILIVGFALGVIAKKILHKVLKEIELNKLMLRIGIMQNVEVGISTIISYLIYLVTIVLFLDYLGIKSIVIYIVVGALLMLLIFIVFSEYDITSLFLLTKLICVFITSEYVKLSEILTFGVAPPSPALGSTITL